MKINFSHTEKALLISLFIEMLIIIVMFRIGFKEKPIEKEYALEFIDDNFKFEDLQPKEEIELPDISKYVNNSRKTNIASNALQKEQEFYEEYRKNHENAIKDFYKNRESNNSLNVTDEHKQKKEEKKQEKSFTGDSNIRYYIKNRKDVFIANPLYQCPKNMSGLIVVNISVDRSGKVISAKNNKKKSTVKEECLISSAIEAAYDSYFNSNNSAPAVQNGYITYKYR
jgi:hypothetical protein